MMNKLFLFIFFFFNFGFSQAESLNYDCDDDCQILLEEIHEKFCMPPKDEELCSEIKNKIEIQKNQLNEHDHIANIGITRRNFDRRIIIVLS